MPRPIIVPVLLMLLLAGGPTQAAVQTTAAVETITFPSGDGLEITADLYAPHRDKVTPLIVLFHQAGWSRGEYTELAPWLNKMGFNCLAVDQRSGHEVNDVANATATLAKAEGKGTNYLDARQDMVSALRYARGNLATGLVIAWGSSYSAALVLVVAGTDPDLVDGVLAFSPGEYFSGLGQSEHWVTDAAKGITVPVFITSARSERDKWKPILAAVKSRQKASFVPNTKGNHGSRALWSKFEDSSGYRKAVVAFLERYFPR